MYVDYLFVKKKVPPENKEIIEHWGKKGWIYTWEIDWELVFYRKKATTRKTRTQAMKEKEILFHNKTLIRSLCSYAFDDDFLELYKWWRDERRLNPSYKWFTERSEKMFFLKLNKEPKIIALEMLKRAIEGKWLALVRLHEFEREKILEPIRLQKQREENERMWIKNEEDFKKQKNKEKELNEYIARNPRIKQEAKKYVEKHNPNVKWKWKATMIDVRSRIIANKILYDI